MATTTGVITIGTISTVRRSRMPRNFRAQNSASARPSTVSIATESATKRTVTQSELRNSGRSTGDGSCRGRHPTRPAVAVELGARLKTVPQRIDQHGEHDQDGRREQQVGQGEIEPCPLQALSDPRSRVARRSLTCSGAAGRVASVTYTLSWGPAPRRSRQ